VLEKFTTVPRRFFTNNSLNPTLLILGVGYFFFHFRNILELGPTWDDWYYPKNFNQSLRTFNPDFESFSTGYGLGGFTVVEVFSRIITFNFSMDAQDDFDSLVARRAVLLFLSFLGAFCLCSIARNLGFSKRLGQVAAILLLTMPNWIGQSSINIKDTPVAVGLILIIDAYLKIVIFKNLIISNSKKLIITLQIFFGIYLSFGTRFGLITFISAATLVVIIFNKRNQSKVLGFSNKLVFTTLLVSYFLLIPLNPILINPIEFIPRAIFGTINLFQQPAGPVLTSGLLLDGNNPPVWYLPIWTIAQMPLTHSILLFLSIPSILSLSLKKKIDRKFLTNARKVNLVTVILLTISPYISAIFISPPLYDGDRQFLMAYPFFVLSMLIPFNLFHKKDFEIGKRHVTLLVSILLLSPGISQFQLKPYTYAFRNELISSPENWEGDYMGVSLREAIKLNQGQGEDLAYDFSDERWLVEWNKINLNTRIKIGESGFLYIATRRGARLSLPPECTEIMNIKREVFGRSNVLSFVALCNEQHVGKK